MENIYTEGLDLLPIYEIAIGIEGRHIEYPYDVVLFDITP